MSFFCTLRQENVALKKIKTKKKLVYEYIFIFLSKKNFFKPWNIHIDIN